MGSLARFQTQMGSLAQFQTQMGSLAPISTFPVRRGVPNTFVLVSSSPTLPKNGFARADFLP
jgi:hypothetical protein